MNRSLPDPSGDGDWFKYRAGLKAAVLLLSILQAKLHLCCSILLFGLCGRHCVLFVACRAIYVCLLSCFSFSLDPSCFLCLNFSTSTNRAPGREQHEEDYINNKQERWAPRHHHVENDRCGTFKFFEFEAGPSLPPSLADSCFTKSL